ncbi:MAG: 30S ribosomal protein S16 [Actinobacteria bacterium]|nr:30S ribosomal protein S16 [Actinomycetota bacterium]
MVKIRLMRVGKKKQPSFRVVVADSRSPRDGRIIEAIGNYHPRLEPSGVSIDAERAVYWLQQGAQPSGQVRKLLEISGTWAAFKGEGPMPTKEAPAEAAAPARPKKTTAAASVKATPAASVETPGDEEPPVDLPEAEDQAPTAPEADAGTDSE